jgi:hypothetical protein
MKVAGRPRFDISLVLCIVAWLTIVYPLGWLSGSVWGAPPSSSATGETQEPVHLEPVVVSASRIEQLLKDAPTHVTIITREDIEQSTARTLDDLLRQIPGFSLFRRSSSLVTHPTAQGVSLRGIGPSGVSRTLVLLDGIPLNDPFGGWVYWSKVPLEGIERIEVTAGLDRASTATTRWPASSTSLRDGRNGVAQAKLDLGTRNTVDDILASHVMGPMGRFRRGQLLPDRRLQDRPRRPARCHRH